MYSSMDAWREIKMDLIKRIMKALGFRVSENNHCKKWTTADIFCLKTMTYAHKPDVQIAKTLGRSVRAIQQKRHLEMDVEDYK